MPLEQINYDKQRFYELLNAHAVIAGRCNSNNPEVTFGQMTVDELLNHLMPNGIRFSIHNIEPENTLVT